VKWTRLELAIHHLADDWDAIRPVVGYGCDAEYGCNGSVGAERDQVDKNARNGDEPDRVDWSLGGLVDLGCDIELAQNTQSAS
jgi:hypothetical protein